MNTNNSGPQPVGSGLGAKADFTRVTNTPEEQARLEARHLSEQEALGWADLCEEIEIEDALQAWGEEA